MITGILSVSLSQCGTCVCAFDIGSHGDTLGADSRWHETRGVLLFTVGLGYHPTGWTAALMVPPGATRYITLCNRCSAGGG